MERFVQQLNQIGVSGRIKKLRQEMLDEPRYVSIEQAKIITEVYQANPDKSMPMKRALALAAALGKLEVVIEDGALIVGNRTAQSGAGVVFPEGGINWLEKEIDDLSTRPQDKFFVRPEDRAYFYDVLVPFWHGKTLEANINAELPKDVSMLEVVGKLNQKDHAQGHICPDVQKWLAKGPAGLLKEAEAQLAAAPEDKKEFYETVRIVLRATIRFIERYAALAARLAKDAVGTKKEDYLAIEKTCTALATAPASNYREAVQSLWFLFAILQMESNASSFSPGRADQYLYPYYKKDMENGSLTVEEALELTQAMFIKFNQIVYLRNTKGAEFFAGFPIGFNIALGGQKADGTEAVNELSYLFLRAQETVKLRQPNLSARVFKGSSDTYLRRVAEVIGVGTGMPQLFNDEGIIPAMLAAGYQEADAVNYAVVGCVEISTHGNALGFSDAAMFNMVKALELTLNDGVCMQTGKQLGLKLGTLEDFKTFEALEQAYAAQLRYFIEKMTVGLEIVERFHKECMPTAFLSSVVDDCLQNGLDVTAGGARYNLSGIQVIQIANLADSMAAIKELVYDKKEVSASELMAALRENYPDEALRQKMLTHAPKYGNDVAWVDELGNQWVEFFLNEIHRYQNYRGGEYTLGLYTVSAHVPMGANVAATPDGRRNGEPLADGGLSAVYGRDQNGPTALLNSVSRIRSENAGNGSLLNAKFAPELFKTEDGVTKFVSLIRGFIALKINHIQFNVVNKEDLLAAKKDPEKYRHLLVRVAGYTANYVDLSEKLQDEIIARTEYGL